MNKLCDKYIKHELGQMEDTDYEKHVESCALCKNHLAEDKKLLALSTELNQPVNMQKNWPKIEEAIKKEKKQNIVRSFIKRNNLLFRVAAVLLIGLTIGLYFYLQQDKIPDKGIIPMSMLEKLEERELEYMESIDELEAAAGEKMADMDLDLMLLYRDKLETIDAQIADCKEALSGNPANAHIRKYLFAALKEKKETLMDVYNLGVNDEI